MALTKPRITYDGVELSASGSVAWKFTTGSRPYMATFSVYHRDWNGKLRPKIGQSADLVIVDGRGTTLTVQNLTLLHEVPSAKPKERSFVLADRRWRWQYTLISRDYNVPKKTGDRTAQINVPFPGFVTTDQYDYKGFSLEGGDTVWTARAVLEDVLQQLRNEGDGFPYTVDSFPIQEQTGGTRSFTLQNVVLRDQGDVALARLLAYIPGATVWVDASGIVRIINGADLAAAENYFQSLPGATWDGERAVVVNRKALRPRNIVVHYQREVEVLLEYSDNYGSGTVASPSYSRPYIENVIQTVDDKTTVTEYDPILKRRITKTDLPPGTWVEFKAWLAAMEADRPPNSDPWTFDTIKMHWVKGNLDVALGAGGLDLDTTANISMRIQAIKQHFRQSFRINRRLMDRTRDIQNVSALLLDPYTGTRGPARVWGQATIIPSAKGLMASRFNKANAHYYRNVDYFAPTQGQFSGRTIEAPHGPAKVNIVDRDLGIFRLDWILSPYGTDQSFIPCMLEAEDGEFKVPIRDLAQQDDEPMGSGVRVEGGTNSIFLADRLSYRVLLTVVPGAPNNKRAFHRVEISASDVESFTEGDWRIGSGEGPDLEVFVAPTEATARFAWQDDSAAATTIGELLGIDKDDPVNSGIEGTVLPGYTLANEERELSSHSRSVASELYVNFADSIQGRVATVVPDTGLKLTGNMSGATVQVAAAPSGKVSAMHEFPGVQKPISRLALMGEGARQVVLGIVRFSGGDS
ncbi:MAG: hypothetical protein GY882_12040 [Actinomycetia bacterium]|nr:hypothetical protein [Actinomycetes bacterium]